MKIPKCKYCGMQGHYTYQCFKKTKDHRNEVKQRRIIRSKTRVVSDKTRRQNAIKELDAVTSKIVRLRASNVLGIATCYTCGRRENWKMMDCGHWQKRRLMPTRWDFDNLRCQCRVCNRNLNGNYSEYNKRLLDELGSEKCYLIVEKAHGNSKLTTVELEKMIEQRKSILKDIISSKK